MATGNVWGEFRRWRRRRPFWGGLILVLSALELFFSANMALNGLEVHLGPQGFLSYLLPLLLLICGSLTWFSPAQRLFYGIVAVLTALYTFVGLNLGGFFLGMLLGIVGGALIIAWGPPRVRPGDQFPGVPPTGEPDDNAEDGPGGQPGFAGDPNVPGEPPTELEVAGHDDRPLQGPLRRSTQDADATAFPPGMTHEFPPGLTDEFLPGMTHEFLPGVTDDETSRGGSGRLGGNPKALAIGLIALAVAASFLVAASALPASAEECPAGLPSRSAAATSSAAAEVANNAAPNAKGTTAGSTKTATPKTTKKSTSSASATPKTSSSASAGAKDASGNPILKGIQDLIDGVRRLLGIDGDSSSSPSTSPTPSKSASETTEPTQTTEPAKSSAPVKTTEPAESSAPSKTTEPAASSTPTKTAEPTASGSEIPCLGARIYGKVASGDDVPFVSAKPGLLKVDSLTMYNSSYDGVVELRTKQGDPIKALKFSMDKAVNKGFNLTVDEPGNAQTVTTSDELTTDQNVRFYAPKFSGKLFGLIPVTFTPEQPPPLTLPILVFTDVEIQLAYVRCDVLTADPLDVTTKR